MAILKCKMCGGNLEIQDGMTVCECEYCGSTQTVPTLDDEKKINLFSRANRLRAACEFDKAFGVYESIVTEFQEEAEAYWGLVLCKYGIEYVDDPKTGKKIPTCHRSSFDSVFEDSNFEMVMECSGALSRSVYREEAKAIEDLRVGIIEVSSKEEPYDIFICYKETAENGERTLDSVLAQDVYDALTDKGYKVFFSRITLEDKLGQEYEPYIFAALNSAKIMLAFGTNYENYNAVWVKNEWSRFLSLIEKGEKKTLIPCFKDIDAYDMPAEFKRLQAQDLGKVGAIQDLLRGIEKIIGKKNSPVEEVAVKANGALTRRGYLYLEDKDYKKAEEYFEKALDENPEDGEAYLGKVFIKLRVQNINELANLPVALDLFPDFTKAVRFSTGEQKELLNSILESNQKNSSNVKDLVSSILNGNYNNLITLAPVLKQAAGVVDESSVYNVFGVSKTVIDEILYKYEIYCVLEKSGKPLNTKEIIESSPMLEKLAINDVKSILVELNNDGMIMFTDYHFVLISDEFRASKIKAQKNIYRTQIEECEQRISVLNDRKSAIPAEIDEIKMSSAQLAAGAAEEKARIDAEIFRLNQEIAEEKKRFKAGCDPDIAERTNLEAHIDNLTKEMSGLGLFQGKRKKELNDQIAFFRQKLSMVESAIFSKQQYFQNFAGARQNRINELSKTVIKYADPADAIKGLEYELSNIDCEVQDLQNRIAELKLQMEQCDWKPDAIDINYFDNDTDYKFAMPVNDAFAITGKGVAVTGCIAAGQIKKRDTAVVVHKDGSTIPTTVIDIEKSRQHIDSAKMGDSVSLLCGGINRNQVAKGDIIAIISGGGTAGTRVVMNAPVNPSVNAPVNRVYDVELTKAGSAVVSAVKIVREITGLDLKSAKDLVDRAPSIIKKGVPLEEARQIKQSIEAACGGGVVVTIR